MRRGAVVLAVGRPRAQGGRKLGAHKFANVVLVLCGPTMQFPSENMVNQITHAFRSENHGIPTLAICPVPT